MMLMTGEKSILCNFIMASKKQRAEIMADAKNDPTISAQLIIALEWANKL